MFNNNIKALKKDYLYIHLNKLQQLLQTVKEPETELTQPSGIVKDSNTYTVDTEEAKASTKPQKSFLYTKARFKPYLTPKSSPEVIVLSKVI